MTNNPKLSIIRDAVALTKAVTSVINRGTSWHFDLHAAFVSALFQVGQHNNTTILNRLYGGFGKMPNTQTSIKQYVTRINNDYPEASCLSFKKGAFTLTENTPKQRAELAKLTEKMINPDGKAFKYVFERDNVATAMEFAASNMLSGLKGMQKKAKGEADNVTSTVPSTVIAKMDQFIAFVETYADADKNQPRATKPQASKPKAKTTRKTTRKTVKKAPAATAAA